MLSRWSNCRQTCAKAQPGSAVYAARMAGSELVALIECPNCRSVIQRALRYIRSTPGLWCEACVRWPANDDIKILDVRRRARKAVERLRRAAEAEPRPDR